MLKFTSIEEENLYLKQRISDLENCVIGASEFTTTNLVNGEPIPLNQTIMFRRAMAEWTPEFWKQKKEQLLNAQTKEME